MIGLRAGRVPHCTARLPALCSDSLISIQVHSGCPSRAILGQHSPRLSARQASAMPTRIADPEQERLTWHSHSKRSPTFHSASPQVPFPLAPFVGCVTIVPPGSLLLACSSPVALHESRDCTTLFGRKSNRASIQPLENSSAGSSAAVLLTCVGIV